MKIKSARIQRFKRISDAPIALGDISVLIGSNNSGKSSIIQGLHFAIGLLQTIDLTKKWGGKDRSATSLSPDDLIYSPSENPYSLAAGGRLIEAKKSSIIFDFTMDSGEEISIEVRKGRILNLLVSVTNTNIARKIGSLDKPFSIFSPGLAGISKRENYVSDGVVLRALARGDANIVLRNILLRLWHMRDAWTSFQGDMERVFPGYNLKVEFNQTIDEDILVKIEHNGSQLPLELGGTGFLQAVQILSYIHRFSPAMIVLDEPDSHLHPNNQRMICSLLRDIAVERNIQVLMTTHSRHVIDALAGSSFLWVQDGTAHLAKPEDEVGILLDIGALDVKERLAFSKKRTVLLTEDKSTQYLLALLKSSQLNTDEILVMPYYGVTNTHNLRPIITHIKSFDAKALILLHRDRDVLYPDEVEGWKTSVRAMGVEPFVTDFYDIESYFLNSDYLHELDNTISVRDFDLMISEAYKSCMDMGIESYINSRIDHERKAKNAAMNIGKLAKEATELVTKQPRTHIKGKDALSALRRLYREKTGKNLPSLIPSERLEVEQLRIFSAKFFAKRKTEEP